MTQPITIQPIEHHQLKALEVFSGEQFTRVFGHLYEPRHLADHLQEKYSQAFYKRELACGCQILVALEHGELVGYIKFGDVAVPIEHQPGDQEIHRLYVHPNQQGKGVGRQLMEQTLVSMPSDADIFLGVWSENFQAQTFYHHYGFSKVGEYDYVVGPHKDHEFIFMRTKTA